MTDEQKCLILTLFQIQNGHRKLSEFADIGTNSDCYISELELDSDGNPSLSILMRENHWVFNLADESNLTNRT